MNLVNNFVLLEKKLIQAIGLVFSTDLELLKIRLLPSNQKFLI